MACTICTCAASNRMLCVYETNVAKFIGQNYEESTNVGQSDNSERSSGNDDGANDGIVLESDPSEVNNTQALEK